MVLSELWQRNRLRMRRVREHVELSLSLPDMSTVRYVVELMRAYFGGGAPRRLRPPGLDFPVLVRIGNSDPAVLHHVFVERAYESIGPVGDVEFVVDCGAYVGYSTLWFLSEFPNAHVVALEPDPENAALLRENVAPHRTRVTVIEAAVWPADERLSLRRGLYRDGKAWSTQVAKAGRGETTDVQGVTLDAVMHGAGRSCIDILKVDIERAERELFREGSDSWLSRTRNLVIELHDEECREECMHALRRYDYELSTFGELSIFREIQAADRQPSG